MATQIDKFLGLNYLEDKSSELTQNPKIKIALKPHQLSLANACKEFEKKQYRTVQSEYTDRECSINSSVGIIGDNVGSGKTYVALSLIAEGKIQSNSNIEIEHHYYGKIQTMVKKNIQQEYSYDSKYKYYPDYSDKKFSSIHKFYNN